jgi:RHS repeat-associated protein
VNSPAETPIEILATYDWLDRVEKTRYKRSAEAAYRFTSYVYDLNSNVLTRRDDGLEGTGGNPGRLQTFTYDGADWLQSHVDGGPSDSSCTDNRKITNTFFATGWEQARTNLAGSGNGGCTYTKKAETTWSWFANGKLQGLTTTQGTGNTTRETHTVGYETAGIYLNGHRTSDAFTMAGPNTACTTTCTATWTYDARDRLVSHYSGHGTPNPTVSYTLNGDGSILTETKGATTKTFAYTGLRLETISQGAPVLARHFYDPHGNLDCITTSAGSAANCSPPEGGTAASTLLSDYSYDGLDRLVAYRSYAGGTKQDSTTYVLDALDRVVSENETHTPTGKNHVTAFSYQGLTNLVTQEVLTGQVAGTKTFSYDAFGHRVSMTDTTETGSVKRYAYAYDVHGSASMLLEDTGTVKASYGYQPYGEPDAQLTQGDTDNQKPLNPYRYTGKRFDSGSGSLDTGARRFDPASARFLQQDVFRSALGDLSLSLDPLTQNRYSLAAGNPVSFIEWDGHYVVWDGDGTASSSGRTRLQPRSLTEPREQAARASAEDEDISPADIWNEPMTGWWGSRWTEAPSNLSGIGVMEFFASILGSMPIRGAGGSFPGTQGALSSSVGTRPVTTSSVEVIERGQKGWTVDITTWLIPQGQTAVLDVTWEVVSRNTRTNVTGTERPLHQQEFLRSTRPDGEMWDHGNVAIPRSWGRPTGVITTTWLLWQGHTGPNIGWFPSGVSVVTKRYDFG